MNRRIGHARLLLLGSSLLLAAVLGNPGVAAAFESPNSPSSGELVERPTEYDGTTVTYEGEAIGEAMVRGDYAWIHLNDDAYMYKNVEEGATLEGFNSGMPVWIPAEKTGAIAVYGDYKHEGAVVRVVGTFNAACAEHGGDMDIHASELEVVAPGREAADPVAPWKLGLAGALTLIAGILWLLNRRAGRAEAVGGRLLP